MSHLVAKGIITNGLGFDASAATMILGGFHLGGTSFEIIIDSSDYQIGSVGNGAPVKSSEDLVKKKEIIITITLKSGSRIRRHYLVSSTLLKVMVKMTLLAKTVANNWVVAATFSSKMIKKVLVSIKLK